MKTATRLLVVAFVVIEGVVILANWQTTLKPVARRVYVWLWDVTGEPAPDRFK